MTTPTADEFELDQADGHRPSDPDGLSAGIARALVGMAAIRIGLGAVSRVRPGWALAMFGAAHARTPEIDYVVRVFGIRAVALGAGYLSSSGAAQRRWRYLALVCDVSDVVTSVADMARGRITPSVARRSAALTGGFAAIGLAALRPDLEQRS